MKETENALIFMFHFASIPLGFGLVHCVMCSHLLGVDQGGDHFANKFICCVLLMKDSQQSAETVNA